MKVKVTKTMVSVIKNMKKEGLLKIEDAQIVEYTPQEYQFKVSLDLWHNESDYDPSTGKFKAIKITYPAEFYAMPTYLTTRIMVKEIKRHAQTFDGLKECLKQLITI